MCCHFLVQISEMRTNEILRPTVGSVLWFKRTLVSFIWFFFSHLKFLGGKCNISYQDVLSILGCGNSFICMVKEEYGSVLYSLKVSVLIFQWDFLIIIFYSLILSVILNRTSIICFWLISLIMFWEINWFGYGTFILFLFKMELYRSLNWFQFNYYLLSSVKWFFFMKAFLCENMPNF